MRSRTEEVYQAIYEEILNGDLIPNQKLLIAKLASKYDVGLSPIREALSQLVATNLVLAMPQRGFRVAPISFQDLKDVYSTRELIEQLALKLSIEKGDEMWEADLLASFHRLSHIEKKTTVTTFKEYQHWEKAHRAFNVALIGACGLIHLLRVQENLYRETERYRRIWFLAAMKKHQAIQFSEKQEAIMQAALVRDEPTATALLHQHFENAQKLMAEYLEI